jgi:hypothetical protein
MGYQSAAPSASGPDGKRYWFDPVTPLQFFDEIAEPNAQLAIATRSFLHRTVNAIMTLDAMFGILHAALHEAGIVSLPRDDD